MIIKKYSWLFRITAWLLMIMLLAILCEGLSYFYLSLRLGKIRSLYEQNPAIGYFHIPNTRINFHFEEKEGEAQSMHDISINSKGLRDKERPYEKAENVYRILVLGDSMVFAHQLAQKHRFTDLLEADLNQANHRIRYEVINAGVNGYGTDNELLFFVREGFKYKPDLVILSFCMNNDVMDNSRSLLRKTKPYFVDQPYFTLENGTLSLKNYLVGSTILGRSSTYRLLSNVTGKYFPGFVKRMNRYGLLNNFPLYGEYIKNGIPLYMRTYSKVYDTEWLKALDISKALLKKFRDEVTKDGSQCLILMVPDKLQLDNKSYWEYTNHHFPAVKNTSLDMEKPSRILNAYLSENEIRFLDLLPAFQEHERTKGRPVYFKVDVHLNEEGHRITAETIFEFLIDEGYLRGYPRNKKEL